MQCLCKRGLRHKANEVIPESLRLFGTVNMIAHKAQPPPHRIDGGRRNGVVLEWERSSRIIEQRAGMALSLGDGLRLHSLGAGAVSSLGDRRIAGVGRSGVVLA